jgi:hypothetical protein
MNNNNFYSKNSSNGKCDVIVPIIRNGNNNFFG